MSLPIVEGVVGTPMETNNLIVQILASDYSAGTEFTSIVPLGSTGSQMIKRNAGYEVYGNPYPEDVFVHSAGAPSSNIFAEFILATGITVPTRTTVRGYLQGGSSGQQYSACGIMSRSEAGVVANDISSSGVRMAGMAYARQLLLHEVEVGGFFGTEIATATAPAAFDPGYEDYPPNTDWMTANGVYMEPFTYIFEDHRGVDNSILAKFSLDSDFYYLRGTTTYNLANEAIRLQSWHSAAFAEIRLEYI